VVLLETLSVMPEISRVMDFLFSPDHTVIVVPLALGLGVTLAIAPQLRNIRLSHSFFIVAWVWSAACIVKEIGASNMRPKYAYPLVFIAVGIVGLLALATFRWVEKNHQETNPQQDSEKTSSLDNIRDAITGGDSFGYIEPNIGSTKSFSNLGALTLQVSGV
jgi:hypothetical protein